MGLKSVACVCATNLERNSLLVIVLKPDLVHYVLGMYHSDFHEVIVTGAGTKIASCFDFK